MISKLKTIVIIKNTNIYLEEGTLNFFIRQVYRNFSYRKKTKLQFARDDPAFLVLLAAWLVVSSVGFAFVLGIGFIDFIQVIFLTVSRYKTCDIEQSECSIRLCCNSPPTGVRPLCCCPVRYFIRLRIV